MALETQAESDWSQSNKLYLIYMPKGSSVSINCAHNSGNKL